MVDPDAEAARLSGKRMDLKPPGARLPAWSCQCGLPKRKRHREPAACLPQAEVEAWRWNHPEATMGDRTIRSLIFIEGFRPR